MPRNYWLFVCSAAICAVCIIAWNKYSEFSNYENNIGSIVIANQSYNNAEFQKNEREKIEKLAKSKDVSIQQAEQEIAKAILNIRDLAKSNAGGRSPGIYIVSDGRKDKIDKNKVIVVPAGELVDINQVLTNRRDLITHPSRFSSSNKEMYIKPVDIASSELSKARFVGYTLGGTYLKGNEYAQTEMLKQVEQTPSGRTGWTTLTRAFSDDDGLGYVLFEESDYTAAGITVVIPQSAINTNVGNYPATLTRLQDQSGRTMSSLSWQDSSGLGYSLKINQIDDDSVASLTRLAESLVKSISQSSNTGL